MRNSRTKTQTKLRNYIKLTAGALLLAITFVLVFAGTLSGAFGIENELQQNGIIGNNVASAAGSHSSTLISVGGFSATSTTRQLHTLITNIGTQRGYSHTTDDTNLGTWNNAPSWTSRNWYFGGGGYHSSNGKTFVWFDFDLGDWYVFSDSVTIQFAGNAYKNSSMDDFSIAVSSAATATALASADTMYSSGEKTSVSTSNEDQKKQYSVSHSVNGRYVRVYALAHDGRYGNFGQAGITDITITLTRSLKYYSVSYDKNADSSTGTVDNTNHKYMEASNITSDFYVGNGQYFTGWNTSANGTGIAMAIGASTGTSTAANAFGNVVRSNLQNGQTTTTLYAQYQGISFTFNGKDYTQYNNEVLQVLQGRGGYLTHTVDSSYSTVVSYRDSSGSEIAQPTMVGVYSAIIEVSKDGKTRGTVTLPFEIIEGDFGKIQGGTGKWGSATNPYVISNETHLKNLSAIVNGRDALNSIVGSNNNSVTAEDVVATDKTYKDCYFVVAADLGTADAQIALVPIGKDSTHYFAGTIFGGNDSDATNRTMRTISLNIQSGDVSNVGLFGYVKGATISYIKTAGTIVGGNATGGLVGCMENGEVFNCANSATVTGRGQVGGIVGYNPDNQMGKIYGTIINDGAINGTNMVGGLVGQWHGEWNLNGTYGTFTNTGDVNGGTGASVGGIAGFADRTIKNAANSGNVVGGTSVGGIAGRCQAPIENSYNTGDVRGTATTSQGEITGSPTGVFVGGITGYTSANASISNCYNTGHISALSTSGGYLSNANYVGGIVGFAQAAVSYCANIGGLIEGNDYLGGIVGNSSSTIDHCYDVQGQRKHRYDTGRIGAISGYGGTATNSWAINAKANDGSTCSNPNPTISNVGKVFVSVGDVAPAVIDGYTEKVWTDILTIKINGFKTTATVTDGKFLASATASNGATSVVPAKIDGALTANANGASAQHTTDATLTYWYNANTSSNIYVQIKNINGAANVKTYNGANQTIDNVSASPFTATAFYFDANYAGTATDGKMNAGTYSVIVDVVANGNVVGRKLFGSWTINTRIISQNSSSATYYYGARILSPDIADILSNIVNGHSVTSDKTLYNFYDAIPASGSRTYTITYTNIRIVANGSDVTGNYKINNSYTFTITVNEGDFGVYGTTDIEKNPWGSPHNPYVIGTKEQLTRLSAIVGGTSAVNSIKNDTYVYVQAQSGDYSGAYFKLADNIPSVGNITPIGSNTHSFAGNFDGNNKTISGLNISVAGNNVGLFGYISGATIKNLTVNGSVKGSQYVGGVVGYALNSTIENVTNNASISSTYKDAPYEIKQFDAHPYDANEQAVSKVNDGNLNSKYYSAKKGAMSFIVQNTTLAYIFGFAITNANDTNTNEETRKRTPQSAIIWGSNNDFQRDNYTSGGGNTTVPNEWGWEVVYNSTLAMPSTSSDRKEFFSGFKLRNYKYYYIYVKAADNYSTLQFAEFDLLTTNSQNVGGVVGYAQGTSINKATNTASVEGDTKVGGIVGYADSTSRMYGTIVNSGNITANSMVGGVSGENHGFWCDTNSNYGTFKNSGSINGRNGATVGGVTAFADKEMCNAENTGNVIGGNAVGGVAGRVQAPIKNSYNSGEIVGTNPTAQGEISVTPTPNGVFVGGITGYTTVNGTISNCYNKGHIAAHSASGDYINNGDYVGGIVGFAQAKVEYCANIGGLIEGNNFIGGIVGSALDNTNIDYCYDVQGQRKFRWDGCNHGSITGSGGNVTNSWAINEKQAQTTANNPNPVVSTKGYRLTTAFAVTPQVDLQNTTNQKWEDILSSKINGFKVVGSVAKNEFFCSDNGSDTNTKYVKPSKTEGFAGDNGDVTTWYSATIASNIRVRVQNITLPTIGSKEYDGLAHGFGHTTYPNTANGAAANNPIVYTTEFLYVGTTYKENLNVSPTNVDVYNTTVTIKIDGQIVGVKKGDTVTITERLLKVSNVWTSASEHVAGDTSNVYIFHYNTQHQGIIENGISVASVHGEFAIPQDVYTIGGYVETKQAHNDTTHTRTFTLNDIRNYKIENKYSQYDDFSPNTVLTEDTSDRGISEATVGDTIVVTYTWKIVPYSLATNITSGNVWFGGRTDLIVGNQGIANVNVGNQSYADKRFYPLQSAQTGVQQVLVYSGHNYAHANFVLYVKYNNGTVAVLTQGTEYTLSALDAPTVENPAPLNTSVTASGKGNFDGDITKWYTALHSDFGGNVTGANWGSADNPYVISKPEHLLRLSQIVNGGTAWNSIITTNNALCISPQGTAVATDRAYSGAYFLVTADINMSGYISTDGVYNFLPIGTRSTQNQTELPFSATFDGGDNTITYVYNVGSFYNVDGARTNYVGLFGYLNGATISNLKVASNGGLSITDNDGIVGIEYVGGIAGCAVDSTLYNTVLAYGGWVRGENYVGGIVGYGERITIESSEAVSSANVGGETYVGGIVGKWIVSNQNQIGGSFAGQAKITLPSGQQIHGVKYVGGIAGWMDTSSCATTISYAPQLNNNGEKVGVYGTEYVGALFGAFIGNGYHQNATNDKYTAIVIDKDASNNFKVGNVKVLLQKLNEQSASGNAKVVGGLVGYAEGVGICFNTDWTTSNVTLDTGNYTPSFIGGIAGVLGKNATIEAIYQLKDDGTFLSGGSHTITHSVPDEQTFGTAAKPLGSFVGGIVGYVSSKAGTYWDSTTTIFGNGIALVNSANIYAKGYVGGIFGALGDISKSVVEKSFENDTNSILYKVLTTGVNGDGNANTTLGIAPATKSEWVGTAVGKLHNTAGVSATDNYVGGIAGYSGAKVRFVLRNTPQDSAIDVSKLNIYSGGSDIFINGSYAGGIAGYLADNLEHELQYIVVQAKFDSANAKRVGGLVGYMGSGKVERCVVTSPDGTSPNGTISAKTDNYQGSEYVGGLVGETQNATIRNSVSTGFNLEKTSNTKGGLLGYGANPTIDSSWTFYIAKKRTNFAKNATPNGAYYAIVSQSPYGKYILVDEGLINATEASYPTFVSLCGFVGLLTNANVEGTLEFAVKVPNKTLNSNYENTQLAFYNASGSDTVTDNVDSFSKFENKNNTLTIALDMASGNSMQICVVGIEFVNVPQKNDTDTDKTTVVEGKYRKPSNSDKYIVHVTTANFNSERQITKIVATVYFECNDNLPVVIGSAYDDKRNIGGYDETFTPGSSTNPYTISSQKEWNDFAFSIYSGANNYSGKYVKLLTDSIVINTGTGGQHAGTKGTHNFGTETTNSGEGAYATDNVGYNFAGSISNSNLGGQSFQGYFDGNGNSIEIKYVGGNYHNVSVFPNATGATFKNLTITGSIVAGDKQSEEIVDTENSGWLTKELYKSYKAASDIAGFVGKPLGKIVFENCTNAADILGYSKIAGFAGYSTSTAPVELTGCINKGNIESLEGSVWTKKVLYGQRLGYPNDYPYGTGGLIAYAENAITIESCLNTGTIIGKTKVGGLVGRVTNTTTINNSANTGYIEATEVNLYVDSAKLSPANAWSRVGGIVGEASQSSTLNMYACYNTGHIRGWSNVAGGLVGMVGTIPNTEKTHSAVADNLCTIAYSYNTGKVEIGSGEKNQGITMVGTSGYNLNGTCGGGLVGVAVKLRIAYSYNTGDIIGYGGVGYSGSWQIRLGGILAEACTKQANCDVRVTNCYSTGRIHIEENTETSDTRYGADIVGYLDVESTLNNGNTPKVNVADCYGVANNIVSYENSRTKYFSGWNNQSGGDVKYVRTGTTLNSLSDLTAVMQSNGTVKPKAYSGINEQTLWNASIATIGAQDSKDTTTKNAYNNGTLGGYVYVYGCLPQLAVFAVDTYNGLSMNSQNFGKDIYGEYKTQKAGEEYSPYVIRDGIDLMGVQTLVGLGYTFEGEYIEFANGSNNITLDKNLSSDVAKAINMPISNSTSTKIADSENAYKSLGKDNTYHIGKSYHLFKLSAVCYDDNNIAQNTAYGYWLSSNHYYNGAYGNKEGAYKNYATFKTQNILTIGRNGNVFKGSISGKQENNANTVINNLRITSGQTIGGAYGGLFGHVENAYIGYIEVGGESNIWAYSSDNQQIAATGAIAGYVTGDSIIEHCAVSGTTAIGAYGKKDDTHIASDITYAGGIVGLTDPKQGSEYKAGISAIIKGCTVNISTTTGDRAAFAGIIQACKSNIGGVLGYIEGIGHIKVDGDEDGDDKDYGASGKSNSVRIEGCSVDKAVIQAASSANTSSQIGGILGYGSEFVAAFITGCEVGNSADTTDTVTIKGEHSLGGIAGGMSNAKGGYIDSCTVGANTTIERIDVGGDKTVLESENHGTAIGGLVGFTQNSNDDTSPLTTTFSGTSAFNGTITVSVESTNKSQDSDAKISCIGGIVGDMGSGASFASGSDVTVGGTIDIKNSQGDWLAAANVGGVAGRTSNATFIGKFDVSPTMNTTEAENVGGFIGKNVGTVYILADTTERIVDGKLNGTNITIGGTIQGTSEVGGFIGVNNSGSTLNIGSNVANAKAYKSGTLSIIIAEGATISGSGNHVGGIVGKNEGAVDAAQKDYATIDIVKGTIVQNGTISGKNYVGGIIGLNAGLLTTGGGEADTSIGGIALSDDQIGLIKNLSITNIGNVTGSGNYVGGVVGKLDSLATHRTEDLGKGAIAGTFTNSGTVVGNSFVGGSLGFVGKNVTITAKNNVATLFVNNGEVNATGYFVGGSIGALVGKIQGENSSVAVKFENKKKVNATGFVGGSIGVLAGPVSYAQFVNSSDGLEIAAVNSVGGSVGYIGVPSPLSDELVGFTAHQIDINNTHFEASGNLTANPSQDAINAAKKDKEDNGWGGVGGAIGVMGAAIKSWTDNTYYANGNVKANVIENGIETGIYNVGGIVGLINAGNITISNMLAYRTTVTGGKNVGGIVGATNGTNTKILSAYTIEGTFSGTENVGGIIGLANSTEGVATDAKTSYWVKGYSNAVLAGADVKDLQQTLGKFETIVEQVTVEGKQQSIVFTEDFCKLYTPKTYYADYPGTHTYNGETVTPGENVEQLTWDNYFKDKLGETSAQIKNGAWVKTVANAVTFTTGTEKTGWYFAFANDATGANGLGTINTNHQGGGDYELKYWKRIANAYTAQERADKEDKKTLDPPSDIVSGGQPQHATLYATATAAGEDSGYYLYMATSGQSRPTATYSTNKFFIQVLTTTTTQAELAQNVAIYYRTISKGKTLTYNGYLRYAPVGITVDDGKTVPYVQTPQQDATKKDSYCYSADTTTGGNATGGAQIDPGNYESAVKIYYYDKDGKPYVVGGVSIKWEIKARQLSADIKSDPHRVYGDNRNQDDGHDMKVVISNIAPGAGTPPQFVITVTDKSSNPNVVTTFKYNGNTLSETKNGITLTATSVGNSSNNEWEASDNLYNVEEPTDKNTKEVLFYIDFTNAKTYEVSVAMKQGDWTKRYTLDAKKDFSVNPAELRLTRSNPASEKYDGTAKSATWFISGFKYQEGAKEFAAFQPQFKTALGKTTDPKVVTLYDLYKGTATSGYTLETNITLGRPGETVSYGEKVENQSKTISYTLSGATQAGDYSIVFPSTGSSITVGNYILKFYEGASPQTKPPVFSIAENKITISISYVDSTKQHSYNGQKKGKITITFKADNEIAGYGDYISNFFKVSINNDGKEISKPSGTTSGKTAQWVFETGVDAKEYKVTISDGVNHTEYVKNCAHDAYPNNIIYKITKAPLTVEFVQTDPTKTTYEYNTYHQGLKKVKLSGLWQNANNNSNMYDSVDITVNFDNKAYSVTIDHNDSAVDIKGIDTRNVGNYTATISNSVGGTRGSNYYISNSSVSTSWKITPHELKLGGLEQDGTKIYDGAAVTPKLTVGGNNVTNGQTTYNEDTIQIKYSATLNKVTAKAIVNAGVYKISIGGSSATDAIKATRDGEDTTKNYTISGTDSATYTISKRPITVTWNTSNLKFVYDLSAHGLTVSGINGGGTGAALQSSSLDYAIVKTGYGNDAIKFTLQGKKVDAGKDYEMSIKSSALNGRIVNDEVESTINNYEISGTACEKKFEIEKSQIIIKYAGGTTSKVYDATTTVKDNNFTFTVSSTNFGANGTSELFDISYVYTDKNVGDNKEVAFTYVFKQNANYEYVGTGTESQNKGQITPAHIKVALNKLRSGKATRMFTNNVWYGGQAGASGNVNSKVYRSGEGFTVSGVLSSDAIKVVAEYREADDLRNGTGNSFDLSSYVNDVVKNADGTFDKAENAGTHFKTLVFTMTGADAKNYTFNVYNNNGTDGKKYSEKDSTAGDTQTVTVYDTRDSNNKNAIGAASIQIEITVKSVRVDYGNAYQSYANADNTYNTNWNPITATSQDITAADGTIDVVNNWMYENNDPTKPKREYHGYTTIRGSEKSTVLGATISKDKGMNFNFRLINQPVLTIAYIVENNGTYEIDTLARLLIASFYYTAHQNPGDQIFMQIVQSGYKWFEVVNGEDYSQVDFAVPEGSPITVDDTIKTWDAYINALNEKGYVVFYNETEKAWGCYVSDSSQPTALPNSYKLTKDISGKFTADDIKVLDAFFTVTTADDNGQFTTKKYTWSGANSDYLKNVLSAAVDKVATINGSLFVSQKAEGAAAITGFDSTFDGNGYVIEYLNIMGYDKENVGLFDVIGANGIVKNLHLRNITINANQGNVGGIAGSIAAAEGDADATKNVTNVSFHGKITATGGTVGGLFGTSARAIDGAIVLGEISATNAIVGGVVGTATADLTKVVSMMQITASGGTVGAFTSNNAYVGEKCTHMTNAVWKKGTSGTGFVNVNGKNFGYNALMSGSNSLYSNGTSDLGTYDVISETFADSGQNVDPRQSKRLRDMVYVYLLMYSLSANGGTYTISASSWLVGTADGTNAKPIVIANKQNVSLLRELRFAAFMLKANVSIEIASTFSGAFYGSVTSETGKNYKITCNKQMFEEYATATTTQAWLEVPAKP